MCIRQMDRTTLTKLKLICLDEMGHHALADVSRFRPTEKRKLVALIQAKHAAMTLEEVDEAFNDLVCTDVLANGTDFFEIQCGPLE